MCWGITCGDGWFDILWDLSESIQGLLNNLSKEEQDLFAVEQVKEKFGGLRYYYEAPKSIDGKIDKLVRDAEIKAYQTCEWCGASGKNEAYGGWMTTLCDKCRDKLKRSKR